MVHEESVAKPLRDAVKAMPAGSVASFTTQAEELYGKYGCPVPPSSRVTVLVELLQVTSPIDEGDESQQRKQQASELKEKGNQLLNTNAQQAVRLYSKGICLLSNLRHQPECSSLSVVLYLNSAHGFLQFPVVNEAYSNSYQALILEPDNAKAHYRLAQVHEECKQYAAALWHYKRSSEITPNPGTDKKAKQLQEIITKQKQSQPLFKGMFKKPNEDFRMN